MSATSSTQPLLHLDSELGAFIPADELDDARRGLLVQVLDVPAGPWDLPALLDDRAAFAVMVVDGLVLRELIAEDRTVLQLQGPGDILRDTGDNGRWVVVGPTQVALLDARILIGVHRWPQLSAGLVTRLADQLDRASRQLAIGQLPNVEQRLTATFWDLAERWGRVGPSGTTVPLRLTHEALGQMVGARRPTVSLALAELADAGELVRRPDRTWLLAGTPPLHRVAAEGRDPSVALDLLPTATVHHHSEPQSEIMREAVGRLRESFELRRERLRRDFERYERTRATSAGIRERSSSLRVARRRPD